MDQFARSARVLSYSGQYFDCRTFEWVNWGHDPVECARTVALHFPQSPLIIPHFGAGIFREAIVADLCPNIYFDGSGTQQ